VREINPTIDRPVRELKGFQRVHLNAGEQTQVTIPIDASSFAYWNVTDHAWKCDNGDYYIEVGSSSRDIRLRAKLNLTH
jgi:beta-glucosidase